MNKISYESRCEVYRKALCRWGDMQLLVAIEEMSEVIKACTKWLRYKHTDHASDIVAVAKILDDLAEEVADATIMLEQLRLIFGINEEVCEAMDKKIERLKERVSGDA